MNRMTLMWTAFLLVAAAGCGGGATVDEARGGLPQLADLAVPLPGDTTASQSGGLSQSPLLGQKATLYEATRGITGAVNGGVVWSLGLIRFISLLPPTSHAGSTFTWGPSQPKNLEPKNNYKLVVTKNHDGSFTYALSGKKTDEADGAFRPIISGTHTPGVPGKSGKGTLELDFDAAQELNDPGSAVGKAQVTYGYAAGTGYEIDVDFTGVKDGNSGRLVNAKYRFQQPDAGPGSFEFETQLDVKKDGQLEDLVVRSRWKVTGTGRSDVQASGGSLAAPATMSECWDDGFGRTYASYSFDPTRDEGVESDCPFATADYATIE